MKERQFEINLRNRHLRYVFFIDENVSYEDLLYLIAKNKQIWGGRFNPIIPVKSNEIEESWKNFARCFDPDFIFYSKGIGPKIIYDLNCYNHCKISELDFEGLDYSIRGIPSAWLINAYKRKLKLFFTDDKESDEFFSFFNINFGIDYGASYTMLRNVQNHNFQQVYINDYKLLFELIPNTDSFVFNKLSESNFETIIINSNSIPRNERFELVISKESGTLDDLLYMWNRIFYTHLRCICITENQLELFTDNCGKNFLDAITAHDRANEIFVNSKSLNASEINAIIKEKLTPLSQYKAFKQSKKVVFPYEVNLVNPFHKYSENKESLLQ